MRMNGLIGLNFMWNGMIITMLLIMAFCFKSFTKRYIFHVLMRLVKVVILTTGTFPAYEASTYFSFLLNQNILSPKCFKEDLTYILDILTLFAYILRIKIKNKCGNQNDLDLFLNGSNFIQNGIIISMLLIKAISFTSCSPEGIPFSSRSMNMRAFSKSTDSDDRNFSFVDLAELLFKHSQF